MTGRDPPRCLQAEEEAWARLPTDVTCCPSESEGGAASDIDDSAAATKTTTETTAAARSSVDHRRKPLSRYEDDDDEYDRGPAAEKTGVVSLSFAPGADNVSDAPLRRQSSGGICGRLTVVGANAGIGQDADGGSEDDVDELLDLEIEIPVPGEAGEEQVGAAVGDIERFAGDGEEGELRQRVNTLASEGESNTFSVLVSQLQVGSSHNGLCLSMRILYIIESALHNSNHS